MMSKTASRKRRNAVYLDDAPNRRSTDIDTYKVRIIKEICGYILWFLFSFGAIYAIINF